MNLQYDFYDDLLGVSKNINFDTSKPLYFVHAENDEQFPLDRVEENVSKFKNAKIDVIK